MKIVVVKLHKKQAQMIEREFADLDLRIITEDSERQASTLAAKADVVVVMTRFIGHSLLASLPRAKVFLCNGGLVQLRKHLSGLRAAYAPQTEKIAVTKPKPKPVAEYKPPAQIEPPNYTALKFAKVGDVLVFPKPLHEMMHAFERKVDAVRVYYKRAHGVTTERNTTDTGIEIMITGAATVKAERRKSLPKVARTSMPNAAPRTEIATTPVAPRDSITQMFWRDVYLQTMRTLPGATHDRCVQRANDACDAHTHRFKE